MVLKLLAAPVLLPIRAVMTVAEQAMSVYYDPKVIFGEFEKLRHARRNGDISDDAYREAKAVLNARLKAAQARGSK